MFKIFISHSNQDNEDTGYIAQALRRAGYGVWVDYENLRGGDAWLCEIEAGISRCDAVLVLLSKASRQSPWVERECLYAFQLKKPLITALLADLLIPLHLINIQYCDLRDRRRGMAQLLEAMAGLASLGDTRPDYAPQALSPLPIEANFFPYIEQLPGGDIASLVARDVYHWAGQLADELAFSGQRQPAFHARVMTSGRPATLLTIRAYRLNPSAQIPLDGLARHAAFAPLQARQQIINRLNRILPASARIPADKADKRPSFPLRQLNDAERLEAFKALISDMAAALRAEPA